MTTGHLGSPRLRRGRAARPGRRGAQAGLLALVLGSAAAVSVSTGTAARAASSCTTSGTTVTCTYTGAGTYQFLLPSGVTSLDVTAVGAAGGTFNLPGNPIPGGPGASVEDTAVPVSTYQGEMLSVVVGGAGGDSTTSSAGAGGSPGGGGAGGTLILGVGPGAGGGGYSGLLDPAGTTALVIAGGGGGAGTGGGTGGAGDTGNGGGAGGGDPSFFGCPTTNSDHDGLSRACGGTGGSSTAAGQGGAGGNQGTIQGAAGSDGLSLAGGHGANAATSNADGGGGGGGGFFGGGGGGSGIPSGGGGGGGSGVVGTLPGGLISEMTATGPASVTISYQVPDNDLSITPPASVTTRATGPSGATVTYPAPSVSDPDDATPPAAVCTPAAGSTFPIGTTTVNCSASDSDDTNSPVTTSFTVTVEGAAAQVSDLTGLVASFNLPPGAQSSFGTQLQAVQSDLQAGNTANACNDLTSVINHAKAQSGKQLTASQASQIVAAAKQVQAVLAC